MSDTENIAEQAGRPAVGAIVEALIFTADRPLRPEQILEIFQHEEFPEITLDRMELEETLAALEQKYANGDQVFELKQIDGGYQFYTRREFYPYVRHAAVVKNKKKLSRASLETLSIVAYRQPITRTELEFIRGVNCDYALRKLLDKNLVEIRGRADAPGRPLLYATSSYFMEYFGINDIRDLPKLEEVSIDEREFQAQFKIYLEDSEKADDEDSETAGKNNEDE